MIAQLIGGAPKVARHKKMVAIHDTVDGEPHGFLLKPEAAIATATRILAAAADLAGRETFTMPVTGIELTGGMTDGVERYARLVLTVEGAPLAIELDAMQVTELAAAFVAAAKALDDPGGPGKAR